MSLFGIPVKLTIQNVKIKIYVNDQNVRLIIKKTISIIIQTSKSFLYKL